MFPPLPQGSIIFWQYSFNSQWNQVSHFMPMASLVEVCSNWMVQFLLCDCTPVFLYTFTEASLGLTNVDKIRASFAAELVYYIGCNTIDRGIDLPLLVCMVAGVDTCWFTSDTQDAESFAMVKTIFVSIGFPLGRYFGSYQNVPQGL